MLTSFLHAQIVSDLRANAVDAPTGAELGGANTHLLLDPPPAVSDRRRLQIRLCRIALLLMWATIGAGTPAAAIGPKPCVPCDIQVTIPERMTGCFQDRLASRLADGHDDGSPIFISLTSCTAKTSDRTRLEAPPLVGLRNSHRSRTEPVSDYLLSRPSAACLYRRLKTQPPSGGVFSTDLSTC